MKAVSGFNPVHRHIAADSPCRNGPLGLLYAPSCLSCSPCLCVSLSAGRSPDDAEIQESGRRGVVRAGRAFVPRRGDPPLLGLAAFGHRGTGRADARPGMASRTGNPVTTCDKDYGSVGDLRPAACVAEVDTSALRAQTQEQLKALDSAAVAGSTSTAATGGGPRSGSSPASPSAPTGVRGGIDDGQATPRTPPCSDALAWMSMTRHRRP